MAEIKTRADSLRLYETGAASDGGSQVTASLGGYRSSLEVRGAGAIVSDTHIANARIDFVSFANGIGTGTLTAASADSLTWTPPGATIGSAVTITNGQTKIIEGADANKYLRVTRTSAASLSGTSSLAIVDVFNNRIGMRNVTAAEATAGTDYYLALMLYNESSNPINSVRLYLAEAGLEIGLEAPVGGAIQTIANESTAPTGITWNSSLTAGSGLSISSLAAGAMYGIWIHRQITAGATASPSILSAIRFEFEYTYF